MRYIFVFYGTYAFGGRFIMLKKLYSAVREYKKPSILSAVLVTCEVVMEVLIPLLMASLIDYGVNAGDMGHIIKMGVALLVAALVSLLFGILAGDYCALASTGFARNLRRDMFANVQTFAFSNIDKFSSASIVTRLTTDVTHLQRAYMMIIRTALRSPAMLIFSLIASFTVDAKISLIFLAVIPILAIGLYIIMTTVHPIFERVFKHYDKLNNIVQENVRGIRVVKSFVREEHEKEKFGDVSNKIYKDFSKAEKLLAFNSPLMQICIYGTMLLIAWFGAQAIVASGNVEANGLTTGQLTSLFSYVMQILSSLMMLSMIFVMITISRASAERTSELLSETSDITEKKDAVSEVKDGSIVFENVIFSYAKQSETPVLSDVDLSIASGETVGIIGGTGSSKSSLVQLIPRLYDVKEGSVKVGGVDVRDYKLNSLRDAVAMVLQKNVLFSGTIKENLRWGNENATDEEMIEACTLACADDFIRSFPDGYDTHIEQGGTNVSGGQKQRLCIARALLKKPKIIILDDSTSAVDTKTDSMIRAAFREKLPDTTKLIIAQRISSVMDADKIVVMDKGRIVAVGKHDELMKSCDVYSEVYESQMKGDESDE